MRTLLLTPWFSPHAILSWKDAVTMKYEGTVDVVSEYDEDVSSPSITWKLPSILRLKHLPHVKHREPKFSRRGVFIRDQFCCQYCGKACTTKQLTVDHIIPRSKGGKTDWFNLVAACHKCNSVKADKSCKQSGMFPASVPSKPKSLPFEIDKSSVPKEWLAYL